MTGGAGIGGFWLVQAEGVDGEFDYGSGGLSSQVEEMVGASTVSGRIWL